MMLKKAIGDKEQPSPSMRREWIEMFFNRSVIKNSNRSPSMRREWIEIACPCPVLQACRVSLHAEGVD